MPLIKIKGGTRENPKYLPAELCFVYPNQSMPKSLINTEIQKEIVESTNTQIPPKRFELIQNSLETIVKESQTLMDAFGLEIVPKPIKLTGRQLEQPNVRGNNRRLYKTIPLKKAVFLNLSPKVKEDLNHFFGNFFNNPQYGLIRTAQGMGFDVSLPEIIGKNEDIRNTGTQMKAFVNVMKSLEKDVQMVFVCIPPKPTILYEYIKYISEIKAGIITQCIKDDLFIKTKPGYFNNFLLKTNAKLNGQNQSLQDEFFRSRLLTDPKKKTIVIGADVTHPGIHNPLANERVLSSIAAVVGSYDQDFTKFIANVSAQGQNTEFITDFDVMFANIMRGFKHFNGKYPENIVLFRDGVSDSQLDAVLKGEIPLIEKAYKELNPNVRPKITAYVVQKRHHTRIFLSNPIMDRNNRPQYNMPSGTVVDHTITNPDLNEFHICSHTGRLGTSRHAKYVVLRNDHNLSQDNLQLLAFSMCFTYCRCLTPISIPIPVKYADLAAYRAKLHVAAQNTERDYQNSFERGDRRETNEQKREREVRNIRKLNETMKVSQNIKVLPYYC